MKTSLSLVVALPLTFMVLFAYATSYVVLGEPYLASPTFVARIFPGERLHCFYYPAGWAEAFVLRKRVMLGERNEFGHLCLIKHHNPWRLPLHTDPPDDEGASSPTPTGR